MRSGLRGYSSGYEPRFNGRQHARHLARRGRAHHEARGASRRFTGARSQLAIEPRSDAPASPARVVVTRASESDGADAEDKDKPISSDDASSGSKDAEADGAEDAASPSPARRTTSRPRSRATGAISALCS